MECIVRGIYHHPFFAKWWLRQENVSQHIRTAIYARLIMNNDLSWLNESTPDSDLPILIWHPKPASKYTSTELARRRPSMTPQIARACINANYQDLFDSLDATPDIFLWVDAEKVPNTYYLKQIEQKAMELGLDRFELSVFDSSTECPEHMAYFWPQRPDVTEMWPMALLAQEMVGIGYHDLNLVREVTVDQVGFEEEGDALASVVGGILLMRAWQIRRYDRLPPLIRWILVKFTETYHTWNWRKTVRWWACGRIHEHQGCIRKEKVASSYFVYPFVYHNQIHLNF
ncbi:hypothetical protein PENSUB_1188 [Penicillium subrubescens]|uniref:Uncharacterized protein n=1 Tax=Penicillium subrubescens TaxID=1316194 RepID=A0A1Q5UKT1_9EURO|nr:hypothetical protein PENSUB_1188 [Penicillium subrubescens]